MLEIVTITAVISIWLLSILFAINHLKIKNRQILEETIANQLVKEWVEMIYQIRNTNLLQSQNNTNCRLQKNPYETWNTNNSFLTWNYILSWLILSWINWNLDLSGWIDQTDKNFAICLTWNSRKSCPWQENTSKYWQYFRSIESKWLFQKDFNITWWTKTTNISSSEPKEFRFCSKVEYIWSKKWIVEICSIMTDFAN